MSVSSASDRVTDYLPQQTGGQIDAIKPRQTLHIRVTWTHRPSGEIAGRGKAHHRRDTDAKLNQRPPHVAMSDPTTRAPGLRSAHRRPE
ncbi:MAG TPA: hypothetical protein VGL34_28560 [Steroidobacteraceae bacterium]